MESNLKSGNHVHTEQRLGDQHVVEGVLMMPNSLNFFGNPLKTKDISYRESDFTNYTKVASIELLQPHADLLTFALYGHDYQTSDYFPFENEHN